MKFLKKGFLFLAPMAGFTNSVCRSLFREYGADGSVTEFVHSRAVLSGAGRVFEKMRIADSERPVGVQLFGDDPAEMADAGKIVEERISPNFIDVNFGCPAPNAVSAGAGAALLRNPEKMAAIILKMSSHIKIPVTAKLRLGWSSSEIIVPEACKLLQDSGVQMITLHGRTKTQGYTGDADWNMIENCAKSLDIPLIGNGSVEKLSASELRDSACAGFMVGRAALGNPWIFCRIKKNMKGEAFIEPSPRERAALALKYAETLAGANFSGISSADLTHAKGQIMRFLRDGAGFKKLRRDMRDVLTIEELKELLCEYV